MFSCVFAGRPSVESGDHTCWDVLVSSCIHGPVHPLRAEASKCFKGRFRWHRPAFHLSVADDVAGTAGTLVGYEELDLVTRQAVPIAGGDQCQ